MGHLIRFARFSLVMLSLFAVVGCAATPASRLQTATESDEGRNRTINDNWRFLRGDAPEARETAFDDATWEHVTLPHTWNISDGSDGGNNYYRGPGWYRRTIDARADDLKAGKRFYLRFGAASLVADVYVNGTHVGQHRGGFAAFCFDVTDQLKPGKNSVSVRVDNSRQPDIAPQSGDFTVFGGLYRDVQLLVLNPVHISPIDDASSGIFVQVQNLSAERASVDVRLRVRNTSRERKHEEVRVMVQPIADRIGAYETRSESQRFEIEAGAERDVILHFEIANPRLWSGVGNANRYQISVALGDEVLGFQGARDTFGIREVAIDPDRGVLLNGKPYAAHGVNTHQEVGGRGWAASDEDYAHAYTLVKSMGATAVRMAHYQHNEAEYALCDRLGLLVWSEIPFVNEFGKASPAFADNLKQQLRELIKQNYNHPSVVTWGLLNEVGLKEDDAQWKLLGELNALAHEIDPSRPTTLAQHTANTHASLKVPDVIAFNRYWGWYGGTAQQWAEKLDADHAANPGRAMAVSEYGAGGSVFQHELNPPMVEQGGPWHPQAYQSDVHEQAWIAMKNRPWLWGTFVWVMFDFSADHRNEGDQAGRNDKGLVTFDQQTKKDAYYFYQANWTAEPMVHITGARYDPYPIGRSSVKVYSNCETVELFNNDVSLGKRTGANGIFVWPDVQFDSGTATTSAVGTMGTTTVDDRVTRTVSKGASTRTTPKKAPTTQAK